MTVGRMAGALSAGVAIGALLALAAAIGGALRAGDLVFIGLMSLSAALEAGLSSGADDASAGTGPWPHRLATLTGVYLLLLAAGPLALGWRAGAMAAAGAPLMVGGVVLRAAALARLGPRFNSSNAIAPGAALETGGVYRRLAHPSELGLLLIAAGGLLLTAPPQALVALAPLYALTLARLSLEERALAARHGEAWRRYRATTFDPMPAMGGFA